MSLIIPTVARLKPEIRLAEAVSQFEASLSAAQKANFRTDRSKALESPPGPGNVMRLTADIDRSQRAGSRCFGPRFTNFLHGVQQFAALGDVIIGGSQNIVACGVWSLVRMSLLAIVKSSSYLESLSLIFMEAGRSAPRYQALALLYPQSKGLQSHINEYFIVIVRLCHRIMAFSQKSMLSKTTSALNDTDLKSLQSELSFWSGLIKDEVGLSMVKRIEDEAQESTRFRTLSTRFSKSIEHRQKLTERLRILDSISTYDFETTWKQTRKSGNTQIFAQTPTYDIWKKSSESSMLVYTGKLGCGKSVMLANIVDDLTTHVEGTDAVVAYFFCRHDLPQSLNERIVIGALARQILRSESELFLEPSLANKTRFSSGELMSLARGGLSSNSELYIVLDGLYLCNRSMNKQIAIAIRELHPLRKVHLCISYRLEPNTATDIPDFPNTIVVPQLNNEPDIEAFIETELERCLASGTLVLGNPTLILDIQDSLLKGSQAMFLWVALQIHSLCVLRTDEEIRKALTDLPRDLTQVYRRILEQSQQPGRSYRAEIFKFVIAARRPLTIHEMREALSVIPDDTTWDPSKLLNDVYQALETCGCLIILDEEEDTIRTVHPSVDLFLISEDFATQYGDSSRPKDAAQSLMTSTIATYLSYGVFGTEVATRLPALEIGPVPHDIIKSVTSTARGVQSLALKLLKSRKQANFDASESIAGFRSHRAPEARDFHFYNYAQTYALQHVSASSWQSQATIDAFSRLLNQGAIRVNTTEKVYGQLCLAMLEDGDLDYPRMRIMIRNMSVSIDRDALLFLAIDYGRTHMIEYLLKVYEAERWELTSKSRADSFPKETVTKQDEFFRQYYPLGPATCYAIKEHKNEIVRMLVASNLFDIHVVTDPLDTPVVVAAVAQNYEALQLLLSITDPHVVIRNRKALMRFGAYMGTEAIQLLQKYGLGSTLD